MNKEDVRQYKKEELDQNDMLTMRQAEECWNISRTRMHYAIHGGLHRGKMKQPEFTETDMGAYPGRGGLNWAVSVTAMRRVFGDPIGFGEPRKGAEPISGIHGLWYSRSRKEYTAWYKGKVYLRSNDREKALKALREAQAADSDKQ